MLLQSMAEFLYMLRAKRKTKQTNKKLCFCLKFKFPKPKLPTFSLSKKSIRLKDSQRKLLKNSWDYRQVSVLGQSATRPFLVSSRNEGGVSIIKSQRKMNEERQGQFSQGGVCLIQRTKTRTNLRFLFKEVVHHVKVFIKRKVSVIRHISSPITSLQHSQMYYTGNILQIWSSIWCFSHLAI